MGGRKQKKSKVQKVPRAGNVFGKVSYLLDPATNVAASTQWTTHNTVGRVGSQESSPSGKDP